MRRNTYMSYIIYQLQPRWVPVNLFGSILNHKSEKKNYFPFDTYQIYTRTLYYMYTYKKTVFGLFHSRESLTVLTHFYKNPSRQ